MAIEIGIGGYQPHYFQDILKNRYGDCKDKATLLSAMLKEIGLESYYVQINSRRGVVILAFPSPLVFRSCDLGHQAARRRLGIANLRQHGRTHSTGTPPVFRPHRSLCAIRKSALYSSFQLRTGGELALLPLAPAPVNRVERAARLDCMPTARSKAL